MANWLNKIQLRQIPELDSIRFLSIVLVVLHHQFFQGNVVLAWFYRHGWVGVDIFFGMSGFLITSLLMKEIERTNTINLSAFWFKRMLRLWPSWFLTLFLSFSMVFFISRHDPALRGSLMEKWWHYFLHFGNYSYLYAGKVHMLYSHFWSLAVEEHFYVLWPLLLLFLRSKKAIFSAIVLLILLPFAFRFYHLAQGHYFQIASFSTHTRIDELLMGCLLAMVWPRIRNLSIRVELFLTVSMLTFFYVGLYVCKGNQESVLLRSLTYTFLGTATCLLITISLKGGRYGLRYLFRFPLTARLGVLSYGVYLIHMHVSSLVFAAANRYFPGIDQNIISVFNLVLPFIPAWFMYFYIDEFFARYRHGLKVKTGVPNEIGNT